MIETKMLAKLKKIMPEIMIEGIETSTTRGFPDLIYGYDDILGFAELKKIDRVPVRKFTVPWRPGQLAWYTRLRKKSKSPYVLILTIRDSWYFITNIKESYTMGEVNRFYIGRTSDLVQVKDSILHVLFPTQ
jgi:hypothetical protein